MMMTNNALRSHREISSQIIEEILLKDIREKKIKFAINKEILIFGKLVKFKH